MFLIIKEKYFFKITHFKISNNFNVHFINFSEQLASEIYDMLLREGVSGETRFILSYYSISTRNLFLSLI